MRHYQGFQKPRRCILRYRHNALSGKQSAGAAGPSHRTPYPWPGTAFPLSGRRSTSGRMPRREDRQAPISIPTSLAAPSAASHHARGQMNKLSTRLPHRLPDCSPSKFSQDIGPHSLSPLAQGLRTKINYASFTLGASDGDCRLSCTRASQSTGRRRWWRRWWWRWRRRWWWWWWKWRRWRERRWKRRWQWGRKWWQRRRWKWRQWRQWWEWRERQWKW